MRFAGIVGLGSCVAFGADFAALAPEKAVSGEWRFADLWRAR
jgi:hypothetical protein